VSGSENSMQELLARAASLLLGNEADGAGDHEAMRILQALEYVPQTRDDHEAETANRAGLLVAASRFTRVFELNSPDAPGLVSFGAQFDPALADPLHAGSPIVGVSGVGLTLRDAFQGCIGEGIEYLSQLQAGTDRLIESGADEFSAKLGPNALELVAALSERRSQPERAFSWYGTTKQLDGREVWLPADICLRRPLAQRAFAPPYPLSIGSAAGPSRDAAALHGLLELIERDAASLWWRGGQLARSIPPQHEALVIADDLLRQLRRGASVQRRTWVLDITTDIGVPCVVAVSCRTDGSGVAFGLAARPALEAAVRSAIMEMCQLELADIVVAAKRRERGDDALNVQDRIHLLRAAIDADQCRLLHPVAEHAAHFQIRATEGRVIFEVIVRRLEEMGFETFCIDLMRQRFGIPVVRVIVPGLQLEPSEIVTARLQDMIAKTGGGETYTGGVALM
jgi:ribosomal protein S12 methylthiotransferase accessory factor